MLWASQVMLAVKNLSSSTGDIRDMGSIPGNIPWRRAWHPLQYSCLESLMDRGAWQVAVHGVTQSRT